MTVGALNMTTENMTIPERVAAPEEIVNDLATREYIASIRADIAELKVLIVRGQVNSIRWTVGSMFAIATLAVAAVKLL